MKRRLLLNGLKLADLGTLVLCSGLAATLCFPAHNHISIARFLLIRIKLLNFAVFALTLLAWHLLFTACRMYQSKRVAARRHEVLDVLKATSLAAVALVVVSILFNIVAVTLRFAILFWVFGTGLVVAERILLRFLLESMRRRGSNLRYMVILGTNSRALEFAQNIEAAPGLDYRILGFVDDEWQGTDRFIKTGRKLLSDHKGLAEFLRNSVVDELVVYLPLRSFHESLSQVAALCEHQGIILRLDSDIFGLKKTQMRAREFDDDCRVVTFGGTQEGWPIVIKRLLDVLGALALLMLLSPILALAALLVRVTSEGPVFFLQERVGLNKRRFRIYKFRTMVPDAEKLITQLLDQNEAGGPVFKIKNDPRITPIGKLLRRTSIDELPQLLNVLKGEMSLVGPRPLPVRDYEGFDQDWQRRRFSVRPGITCLWQVSGRSSITFEQWMKLDLQYLDEWSLWLDLQILVWTIPAVLKGSGAI
jgi:exopolysaccharide biosynthesis polyprenyl glycosylphosphotransferase